jgi:hypothetical protein
LTRSSASQTPSSSSPNSASPRVCAKRENEPNSVQNSRRPSFVAKVYQRDSHCVVTKGYGALEASHILSLSWRKNTEDRRLYRPQNIIDNVNSLTDKIDGVKNGLLLLYLCNGRKGIIEWFHSLGPGKNGTEFFWMKTRESEVMDRPGGMTIAPIEHW